jgi:hypothetical protein
MKKVSLLLATGLLSLPGVGFATDFSYSPWYAQLDGDVQNQGREISLNNELGLSSTASHGWVVDEGWLKLSYVPMSFGGNGVVTAQTDFGGSSYSSNANVRTDADFTDLAARFLWRPFEALGVGLTAKILDGEITVSEEGGDSENKTISEIFPLLSVTYTLPVMEFFNVNSDASYVKYGDNEVLEMGLNFELRGSTMGFSAGWHEKRYDVQDNDFRLRARIKGIFAQISVYL